MALGARFQVKKLHVKPGGKLSMQMHHHRSDGVVPKRHLHPPMRCRKPGTFAVILPMLAGKGSRVRRVAKARLINCCFRIFGDPGVGWWVQSIFGRLISALA